MEGNWPLVTVFTLVYNTNPKYVIEAIDSIYAQTYKNIEHIIVNDDPNDQVHWPVIKDYIISKNLPSYIIEHEKNYGICKTLNQILNLSNGKYILGCSDDILLDNRISRDIDEFELLPMSYSIVFSMCDYVDLEGVKLNIVKPVVNTFDFNHSINTFNILFKNCFIKASSVTIRKSSLLDLGGFDENYLIEDYPLWLNFAKNGYGFKFLPEVNTKYRINPNGFTLSKSRTLLIEVFKIKIDFACSSIHKYLIEKEIVKSFQNFDFPLKEILKIFNQKYTFSVLVFIFRLRMNKFLKFLLLKGFLFVRRINLKLNKILNVTINNHDKLQ